MANPNNFPNIEGSELVSQSWTKLLERDASVKKQFAASEFPEVTADDVGTPCYREDEQKWYIFTGMGELDTPIWWCPFDEIAAESVAFEPTEEFPASADTVAEALDFLSKKELPNAIIMPAESSEFVGDNVRAEFPLQKVTSNKNTIHVFFSGVKQSPSSYELGEGGESVIFNEPPAYGETILIQENATILEYDLMPLEASFVAENETTFKMPVDIVDVRVVQVNVAGTVLQHNQYKVEGRNVILNEPVTGNVQITTIYKGQLSSPAPNTVNTVALQDEVVTGEKIADGAITESKLADASIGTMKIADNAITENKLPDGVITSNKIADKNIKINNLSDVVEGKLLGTSRVESEMLKDGSVNLSKLGEDVLSKLDAIGANVTDATENMKGVVQLASTEEVLEGEGDNKVITSEVLRDTLDTIQALGGSRNIGDIFYTSRLEHYVNGSVPCDGSSYDIKDYEGEASIGKLFKKGYLPYISIAEYDTIVEEKGSCRCFGWDGGDTTLFKVPTLDNVYISAGEAAAVGEFIDETLPNIKGTWDCNGLTDSSYATYVETSGAMYSYSSIHNKNADGFGDGAGASIGFDASRDSKVYQDGAKVKPDSVKYRAMVQLYTGAKEISITDYTNIIEEVIINAKEDVNNTVASGKSEIEEAVQEGLADIDTALGGGGLEIGDIGIAPLGIDETQNKRRYLNGQVISQSQFVSFTNWVKERANLYPNTVATEENWQAEVTNSKLGQCGKFVIDDELGTIRLPKVVNINGLSDLALMGSIKSESLPNITGNLYTTFDTGYAPSGAFSVTVTGSSTWGTGNMEYGLLDFNSNNSSSTYQDNAPVQQEAIQYPYFIQVATGVEESVDVTREIELNNPFFLGMSQYFESEPKNASWLISNGSFHSGATYVSFYEWLLKIYNGTEIVDGVSVKVSTDTYGDYDYVINTADTTFRLPIYDGSESILSDKYDDLTLGVSGSEYVALANGCFYVSKVSTASGQWFGYENNTSPLASYSWSSNTGQTITNRLEVKKGEVVTVIYNIAGTLNFFRFIYAQGNGSLYYYVGETIQNANLINAAKVIETVQAMIHTCSGGNPHGMCANYIRGKRLTSDYDDMNYIEMWHNKATNVFAPDSILLDQFSHKIDNLHSFTNHTPITIVPANYLDTGTTLEAGKDYYGYICWNGTSSLLLFSLDGTAPSGFDKTNSKKICGFHTLCADAGTIEGHIASDFTAGSIIPNSIWCTTFRPLNAKANGAAYVDTINQWVDIYLQSGTGANTASAFGATITDTRYYQNHVEDMLSVGKHLPTDNEFTALAWGSNQRSAIKGAADPVTTGGHVDTAGRRMISQYFLEDCCGALWQWLNSTGASGGSNWTTINTDNGSGDFYGEGYVLLAGGVWSDSSYCGWGSRAGSHGRSALGAGSSARGLSHLHSVGLIRND